MHTLDNLKHIKSLTIEINYHFDADQTHPLEINNIFIGKNWNLVPSMKTKIYLFLNRVKLISCISYGL